MKRLVFFSGVFVVAFILRLVAVHLFQTDPVNDLLWNDAVAWNLAQGNGYTASVSEPRVPGIFRTPGYQAFLAVIYFLFGHSYYAAYVANALIDAGSAVLIGLICLHYVSVPMALLTSALYAIYPYPAMFCPILHQDILLTFSVLCVLFLIARATRRPDNGWLWFSSGLTTGIATLIKANFILFLLVPILTLFIALPNRRRAFVHACLILLGAFLVVGPWMLRNYRVFNVFPLLAVGGTGTNLSYLVTEVMEGEKALIKRIVPEGPPGRSIESLADGASLIAYEKRLTRESIAQLRRLWPRYAVVVMKHIPRLWFSRYAVWHSPAIRIAGQIISLLVLIPGIIGMILLRKQWRTLFPFYLTIFLITFSYAFYTVEARYTLPARPAMLLFVAATILAVLPARRPALPSS